MGSGRGQSRRAAAVAATNISGIATSIDAWTDFVESSEIGTQNLRAYYGLDGGDDSTTPRGIEELATELFRDLITMRAIILPPDWGADDFNFRVHARTSKIMPTGRGHDLVLLSPRDRSVHEHVARNPEKMLKQFVTFASPETLRMVGNILEAVDDIRFSRQKP